MAIVGTWFIPIFTFFHARPYQGELPPDALQVKVHGNVEFGTEKNGFKSDPVAQLIADSGERFTLQDSTISEIEEWERKYPRALIHVEGFRLRNGAGNLWIESATGDDGEVILHRSKQHDRLMFHRTVFGKALFLMYAVLVAPFWLISFFNVRTVRTSLGA